MHFLIYEITRRVEIKPVNPIHIVYAIYDIPTPQPHYGPTIIISMAAPRYNHIERETG